MSKIVKIISGGQTGADMGGLLAARDCGIATGGTAPRGFLTENGSNPKLGFLYGLKESHSVKYKPRTVANIYDSDCTLLFGNIQSAGTAFTIEKCQELKKPFHTSPFELGQRIDEEEIVRDLVFYIKKFSQQQIVINIGGNRESVFPKIESIVQTIMKKTLVELL